MVPVRTDWARLAAYIDGEGSIQIRLQEKARKRVTPVHELSITVCSTDPRLPQWCKELFGGSVTPRRKENSKKQSFLWVCKSRKAEGILLRCKKFFLIKGEHAAIALAFRKSFSIARNGHGPVPVEVVHEREDFRMKLSSLSMKGKRARISSWPEGQTASAAGA